jgi:hypothetical protein
MKSTVNGAVPAIAFDTKAATGVDTADAGKMTNILARRMEKQTRSGIFFMILLPNVADLDMQHEVSCA